MDMLDYTSRIPEAPADLLQWLKDKGCFAKNWLIYQCGWSTEILSGEKERCLDVVCTACGKHFKADREADIDFGVGCSCGYPSRSYYSQYHGHAGESIIEDSKKTKCPLCGAEVECMHVSRVGHEEMGTEWPLVFTRDGENLIAAAYRVMRVVDKQGASKYLVQKYEAYVFTPKKAYRLCGWHPGGFGIKCLIGEWEQRKRCTDQLGSCDLIYTAGKDVFRGTSLENSKFYRYMKNGHEKRFPISYLLFYKKHPQVENLLVQGYGWLVSEAIRGQAGPNGSQLAAEAVNWKEVSPRKMLGLSKPDFETLKGKEIKSRDIVSFRKLRKTDPSMNPQEVIDIVQTFAYSLDEIVKLGQSAGKIARYCVKQAGKSEQKEKQVPSNAFTTWQDYTSMAKKMRYNLKEESVKFPPHLYAAHDRAVMATKYKENEALKEQFRAMYERLLPFCFEKDGLLIRPAASEEELIKEGKILQHCVGGYGKTHCNGKPIFFIRKAAEPDMPYYTLNLDLDKKYIIQNHGYRNEALAPVPPEVTEFANYWLENVVKADTAVKTNKIKKKKAAAA